MSYRRFWRDILHKLWVWLVITLLAWVGNYQMVIGLIPDDWVQSLPKFPHLPWQLSLAITVAALFFVTGHAAYGIVRKVEAKYEDEIRRLKDDYDGRLQVLDRASLGDLRPMFVIEEMQRYDGTLGHFSFRRISEANLMVRNIGDAPIRARVTGKLIGGSEELINLNRPYGMKWQGTTNDEIEISGQDYGILNILFYGPVGRWSRLGLCFQTCKGHASGRGFFVEALQSPWAYIKGAGRSLTAKLEVRVTASLPSNTARITRATEVFEIRVGETIDSLAIARVADS